MINLFPDLNAPKFSVVGESSLIRSMEKDGQLPPMTLTIKPLEGSFTAGAGPLQGAKSQLFSTGSVINRFLDYKFSSSILIPVDTFSFNFVAPDGPPLYESIKEGDIAVLAVNDINIATGLVDSVYTETDAEFGEKGSVNGRDLLSQIEDQDAISMDSTPIWGENVTVETGIRFLLDNTRITKIELRDTPKSTYLLATEPGESKMAAIQRFLEPLNCLAWMSPTGTLIVGKPNFSQPPRGRLILSKSKRQANVMSMNVMRASTTIPNVIVPIWTGQETTTERISPEQALRNARPGPSRLLQLGHRLPKTVVVGVSNATDPQGLAEKNLINAGAGNLLQACAKREMSRKNIGEMVVQAVVPGHCNENGEPYVIDTVYHIEYDRGSVDEKMYLYQVEYDLTAAGGQRTNLFFCRLGCIVSDVNAP